MNRVRKYTGPVFLILTAILLVEFPMIAAFFVSTVLIIIALVWIKLLRGYSAFTQSGQAGSFEQKVYQNGEPGFKNLTVTVFDYYKKN